MTRLHSSLHRVLILSIALLEGAAQQGAIVLFWPGQQRQGEVMHKFNTHSPAGMHLSLRAIFWNQRSFRGVLPHGALTRVSIVCESRYFHWVAGSQTSGRQTSLSQHSCMQLQSLSGVSTEPQAMFQGRSSEPVAVSTWTLPSAISSSSQYPPAVLVWPALSISVGHGILRCTSKGVCTRSGHISVSNGDLSRERSMNRTDRSGLCPPTSKTKTGAANYNQLHPGIWKANLTTNHRLNMSQHHCQTRPTLRQTDNLYDRALHKHKGLDASDIILYYTIQIYTVHMLILLIRSYQ